ncbi:hypothetical protein GOBAR_DD22029 [Gossypium barbadense]|nr:hypothetical protein GOBAR_DD22029 [Gossypium barbadense]
MWLLFFKQKAQKNYGKPQFKNKWDTLKNEWRLWRELLKESTATGENTWAPSSGVLPSGVPKGDDAPNEGFSDSDGHSNENEATGENTWAPSSGVLPSGVPKGDDAPNEGFSDSDGHSNENEGIPPDEIKKLCESMASSRKSVKEIIFPHSQYTISNTMDALRALGDEIPKKDELYYFATKMLQILVKREVFLNLDPNDRVWWLRQNPRVAFPLSRHSLPMCALGAHTARGLPSSASLPPKRQATPMNRLRRSAVIGLSPSSDASLREGPRTLHFSPRFLDQNFGL